MLAWGEAILFELIAGNQVNRKLLRRDKEKLLFFFFFVWHSKRCSASLLSVTPYLQGCQDISFSFLPPPPGFWFSCLLVVIWRGHANKDEHAKELKVVAVRSKPKSLTCLLPASWGLLAPWNNYTFLSLNNSLSSPFLFLSFSFFFFLSFKKSACLNKEIF